MAWTLNSSGWLLYAVMLGAAMACTVASLAVRPNVRLTGLVLTLLLLTLVPAASSTLAVGVIVCGVVGLLVALLLRPPIGGPSVAAITVAVVVFMAALGLLAARVELGNPFARWDSRETFATLVSPDGRWTANSQLVEQFAILGDIWSEVTVERSTLGLFSQSGTVWKGEVNARRPTMRWLSNDALLVDDTQVALNSASGGASTGAFCSWTLLQLLCSGVE